MSARDKVNRVLIHVILILVSLTMLVPFLWMILTAFKTMTEATSVNPFVIFPSTWRWDSFKEVIENMDFLHLYLNTLLLILGRVICAVLTATLAGYAFGRLNFKGKNLMFSLVLFQMMVPGQIFIIPQYLMVSKMGMLNTIFALVFPGIVTAFGTFLLKQAYMGLPKDLEEAAVVDGANILQQIWYVQLPAIKNIIVIQFILQAGNIMSIGFEKAYALQTDMNLPASEILSTYVYRIGLLNGDYGYSTAVGLFNSVINVILLIFVNPSGSFFLQCYPIFPVYWNSVYTMQPL